jgi:hypothetical protein
MITERDDSIGVFFFSSIREYIAHKFGEFIVMIDDSGRVLHISLAI